MSAAEASGLTSLPLLSISKRGAGFGRSKRGLPVAGESPMAMALFSKAGLGAANSTLLLHFGQRMLKAPVGTFVSSTCNREEHFWQTIIIRVKVVYLSFSSEPVYSIMLSIDPLSEMAFMGIAPPPRCMNSSAAVTPLSERRRLF